jgi:hypothetical protein
VVALAGGCGGKPEVGPGVAAPVATEQVLETPTPEPTPVADEPTATPPPSKAPTPSRTPSKAPKPRAKPKPPTEKKVPPPPPKPVAGCTKPKYVGTQASRAQVRDALSAAAAKTYWPTSAPDLKVPLDLIKATAWQESGWQSNIVACDGGVGLMQVMPATATWMNDRFGQSYQIDAYRDNAVLGANYLAWLTKYIGDMYFEDYSLSAGNCSAELNSCLLNAVIAAYNFGHGAVAVPGKPLAIPNPQYVRNVRALMTECECLSF